MFGLAVMGWAMSLLNGALRVGASSGEATNMPVRVDLGESALGAGCWRSALRPSGGPAAGFWSVVAPAVHPPSTKENSLFLKDSSVRYECVKKA